MQPIIYDVAISRDGFICGEGGDISRFHGEGDHVAAYLDRLAQYAVVLMGRETYIFGYRFGMAEGANPYPASRSIVVSDSLTLPADAAVEIWRRSDLDRIQELKATAPGPIYLCGGGVLAGALLAAGQIDRLRLKISPILLGSGTALFGGRPVEADLSLNARVAYETGVVFEDWSIRPAAGVAARAETG